MKKNLAVLLTLVLIVLTILTQFTTAFADITLVYDGQPHNYSGTLVNLIVNGQAVTPDVPSVILQDRTMIPIRAVLESFGANISFDATKQLVTAVLGDYKLELKINSNAAVLNDSQNLTMDVPAKIINDRTLIPLRFVSESLGLVVGWNPDSVTASIDLPSGGLPTIPKANLTNVQFQGGTLTSQVTLTSDAAITSYQTFTLGNPQRVVVDLSNTIKSSSVGNTNTGDANITGIRTSQYASTPAVTRVVMDLTKTISYQIKQSQDKKTLTILFNSASPLTPPVDMPSLSTKAKDKLVVIDAGHGGSDSGAVGKVDDQIVLMEKDVTLDIAKRVNVLLESAGVKTAMSRDTDVLIPLMDIPKNANNLNADLFLSVHCNAVDGAPEACGTESLYFNDTVDPKYGISGMRFAEITQAQIVSELNTSDRGIVQRPNLVVLKYTNMPAIIAETAFITNESDRALLSSDMYKDKFAEALARAVILALNESVQ